MNNRIKQFYNIIENVKWNLYTTIESVSKRRDPTVWLFGAWMGEKFADNSRFLFQYLHDNKSKYGIEDVIWASRNPKVVEELMSMGYHSVLIGTKESRIAHLTAKVHIICNSDGNSGSKGDIDTRFSLNAIKINLWHGVGIKASGCLKNGNTNSKIRRFIHENIVVPLNTPGHWKKCYFLTTSSESERVIHLDNNIPYNHIIRGTYPRLCECNRLLLEEEKVIKQIKSLKKLGNRVVLYLPTFRNTDSCYILPEKTENFDEFLTGNNIIWIEKKHSADKQQSEFHTRQNVIALNSDFDINVIYKYIDLLVTDYSSAASDAMFWGKPTLEYCPDFQTYSNTDRGFVAPFEKYHAFPPIINPDDIQRAILERLEASDKHRISEIKAFLFGNGPYSYEVTMHAIMNILNKE